MSGGQQGHGFLVDIVGCDYCLVSHSSISGSWAATSKAVIREIPNALTQSYDIETGLTDLGGTALQITNADFLLEDRKNTPATSLTATISATDTTITVDDNSAFPASGTIWIEQEAITYSSKPASTQFAVSARDVLGSAAAAHSLNYVVYGFNPTILGRRVDVYWVPLDDHSAKVLRFRAFIDAVNFTENGADLVLVSSQMQVRDTLICAPDFASGQLRWRMDLPPGATSSSRANPAPAEDIHVDLQQKALPIPNYSGSGQWQKQITQGGVVRVGSELIHYKSVIYPIFEFTVDSSTSNTVVFTISNSKEYLMWYWFAREGDDMIDIVDSSDVLVSGGEGLQITKYTTPSAQPYIGSVITVYHNGNCSPVAGDKIQNNYACLINKNGMVRGYLGSPSGPHDIGEEVAEVRVLKGNAIEILLACLFSDAGNNTAGPSSGIYDVLPDGWGLAFNQAALDVQSFLDLMPSSYPVQYILSEPLDPEELIKWTAFLHNAVLSFDMDGIFRARKKGDLYPNTSGTYVLDSSTISGGATPQMNLDFSTIINSIKLSTDYDSKGEATYSLQVIDAESVGVYGKRTIDNDSDIGLTSVSTWNTLYAAMENLLHFRSRPLPIITLDSLFQIGTSRQIGETVALTLQHLPDVEGSTGYSTSTFTIIENSPNPQGAVESLKLMGKPNTPDLGRVCFCGIVDSISGTDIVLKSSSVSGFSNTTPPITPPASGMDGSEDVEWFVANDAITFWDESSFGGTVATHDTTISSIDYASRTITVGSVPSSWTLADGDMIKLDTWADVGSSSTAADRQYIFLCQADGTNDLLALSTPYRWGA